MSSSGLDLVLNLALVAVEDDDEVKKTNYTCQSLKHQVVLSNFSWYKSLLFV